MNDPTQSYVSQDGHRPTFLPDTVKNTIIWPNGQVMVFFVVARRDGEIVGDEMPVYEDYHRIEAPRGLPRKIGGIE